MKISVVTVCYNSAATIGYTLESFFAQDHREKELVIVDGASKDNTLDIVRTFPREGVRVISEPDRGIYDAMNKGLRAFTGDSVGFLNSDDRYKTSRSLTSIAEALEDADIAYGDLDIVRAHDRPDLVRRWRSAPFRPGAFRRGWMPAHPTFYCRRGVVEATGLFDLKYRLGADYDYMLRAMELSDFRSGQADGVLVDMLHGGASSSGLKAHFKHNMEALDSRRRWLGSGLVDYALFAKPLRKLPQMLAPPTRAQPQPEASMARRSASSR